MTEAPKDWLGELRASHADLSAALNGFRVYLRHALPDTVLFHWGLDVVEHTHAIALLSDSPAARAGMSNARSAYEAALYMLVLTASASEYDRNGAMVRACELIEIGSLHVRRAKADGAIGKPLPAEGKTPEETMSADGKTWERELPGAEAMCVSAIATARSDKRWKKHWNGSQSWSDVARATMQTADIPVGLVEMADALYGAEAFHSHPRPRAGNRPVSIDDRGRHVYGPNESDGQMVAALGWLACGFAKTALERRKTMAS